MTDLFGPLLLLLISAGQVKFFHRYLEVFGPRRAWIVPPILIGAGVSAWLWFTVDPPQVYWLIAAVLLGTGLGLLIVKWEGPK